MLERNFLNKTDNYKNVADGELIILEIISLGHI